MSTGASGDDVQDKAVVARGVTRCYGEVVALDGVDLEIGGGEVHGLVGPNGAGKTTLLGLLLGLAAPDAGSLDVLGVAVTRPFGVPGTVAGFVDAPGLYPALTARQNLVELARLRGIADGPDRARRLLAEVGLADVADDRVRGFSLGMRQRLGIAASLMTSPRLLVLDEPTNGLDPAARRQVHDLLRSLAASGVAVLLSSHRMEDLERLCDRVTVLSRGRVEFSGSCAALADQVRGLDYRVLTNDQASLQQVLAAQPAMKAEVSLVPGAPVVVHATDAQLEWLVRTIVDHGLVLRELSPVMSPLEAAFLRLTEASPASSPDEPPLPAAGTMARTGGRAAVADGVARDSAGAAR